MQRLARRIFQIGYVFLCFAPVILWIGRSVLGEIGVPLILLAIVMLITYAISFVPGYLGGNAKKTKTLERTHRGNDPDPDRHLRDDAQAEIRMGKRLPLRLIVCVAAALGVFAAILLLPISALNSMDLISRVILSAVIAIVLPIALTPLSSQEMVPTSAIVLGVALYAVSGIALYVLKQPELNRLILWLGLAFLAITGLFLNERSLEDGMVVRRRGRLPGSIRSKNRWLLLVLAVVVAIAALFDQLRDAAQAAGMWLLRAAIQVFIWISNLFIGSETPGGAPQQGGQEDMLAGLGGGESAAFWVYLEKVALVLAMAVGAVLLIFALRKLFQKLRALFQKIGALFKRFSQSVGEDYQDERESLIDWGETQRAIGDSIKKRWHRLVDREKKWNQMDARERVRAVMRALYRKNPASVARAQTAREAVAHIDTGEVDRERLCALYDRARYGGEPDAPDPEDAEGLRRALRPIARL